MHWRLLKDVRRALRCWRQPRALKTWSMHVINGFPWLSYNYEQYQYHHTKLVKPRSAHRPIRHTYKTTLRVIRRLGEGWSIHDRSTVGPWVIRVLIKDGSGMIHDWFMNDSWLTHEGFMNGSWLIREWFMNDSCLSHDLIHDWFKNDSWTVHEWCMID